MVFSSHGGGEAVGCAISAHMIPLQEARALKAACTTGEHNLEVRVHTSTRRLNVSLEICDFTANGTCLAAGARETRGRRWRQIPGFEPSTFKCSHFARLSPTDYGVM